LSKSSPLVRLDHLGTPTDRTTVYALTSGPNTSAPSSQQRPSATTSNMVPRDLALLASEETESPASLTKLIQSSFSPIKASLECTSFFLFWLGPHFTSLS